MPFLKSNLIINLMKQTIFYQWIAILLALSGLQSCIGDDIIQDLVPEQVRILNPLDSLPLNETFQFSASYFNNIGVEETATIVWSSSDESILSITADGTATSISEGTVIVTATTTTSTQEVLTDRITIQVSASASGVPDLKERTVTIRTTSSYVLEGTGVLKETASGELELAVNSDFRASSSLPGLYVYLTNNPNTLSGAFEIGRVTQFSGAHSYTFSGADLNTYAYVLFFCKPFVVKVGDGELAD